MAFNKIIRIHTDGIEASGDNLEVFVETGSLADPIIGLAENVYQPYVRDFYARAKERQGEKGVHISIRYESTPNSDRGGMVIHILQEDIVERDSYPAYKF
ncbi:hypothetical protein CON74_23225 [Bacillus thuringiensis]|uniref:hypothetical protein n=1 Tax=Bacillus thuringiensis TaxID=1428 RepID=UPI000BED2CFE|nr:hypothetical protein [Bacillus thuringiensis]PEA58434.1 hypothetical protein CON74_23225 [Bacillus thuringiensis]